MSDKKLNRIIATGVFLTSFVVYLLTISRTVVFWDVGEYLASAFLLQVPHPPGAPLLLLVGHLFSMVPFSADPAYRMHLVSALSGGIVVAFLYLISVKVFKFIRGTPESAIDKLAVHGVAVIAALSLAFSYSFWNNSIEFEAKGTAMFFVAFILWLALRWSERADQPHNEKYLLLIAYLVGLCIGVRPLAVLTIFPVGLIVYITKYRFERRSFLLFSLGSLLVLAGVYPGIVQFLPSFLNGQFQGIHSDIFPFIPLLLILAAAYGVYRTLQTKQKMLHIACLSFLLIVLGYTTYSVVLIRANVDNLPINENDPSDLTRLTSYLAREQYGETPQLKGESWDNESQSFKEKLFPRRYSQEAMHEPTRANYTSDWDFFWRYQVNHMYIRYLLRNYIGPDGYAQDDGVSASGTFAIPFLLGLLGLYYHFNKHWKMGLVFLSAFLLMGVIFALYQNQQEPQPRERDYFYAGSYFVFSLWIGVGVLAIMDFLKKQLSGKRLYAIGTAGVLVLAAVAVPMNLLRVNWYIHDRNQNDIAWDYSYNLLQSCEPNAIMFTNGDNDTFPLWYLQDVEGVRRDIRIVNLSLVNTPWYISQLKNQMPHGTAKVPISLTDEQISRITPVLWKSRQLDLAVPKKVMDEYIEKEKPDPSMLDSNVVKSGKIVYTLAGIPYREDARILRVQDIMVRDIITANKWERPIYFAVTVSPDSKMGLDNYLWMQGQAYKLKPLKVASAEGGLDVDIMGKNVLAEQVTPSKTYQPGFLYRNLNNPHVYYDENVQRMVMNYRASFIRLAENAARKENNKEKARKIMARMEETIPLDVIPIQDWRYLVYLMRVYKDMGDDGNFTKYANQVEGKCNALVQAAGADQRSLVEPYQVLLEVYDIKKEYRKSIDILNALGGQYPNDPEIKRRIEFYEQQLKGAPPDTNKKG